jgi:signal transduction histidine kinase
MEIKQLTYKIRNDFNRAISLAGVIPLLVFVYLVVGKLANFKVLVGEIGYIVMATIGVFVMGIVVGRRMLMAITLKLIDDNSKILSMQKELIAKNRLAAITETVLALGDQVNNPLLVISGNLELLDLEIQNLEVGEKVHNRIATMRGNFQKIREVTDKMSKLTKVELVTIHGDTQMIDLNKSTSL